MRFLWILILLGCSTNPPPDPDPEPGPCEPYDWFCRDGYQGDNVCVRIDSTNVCVLAPPYELHYAYECERGWHLVSDDGCPWEEDE